MMSKKPIFRKKLLAFYWFMVFQKLDFGEELSQKRWEKSVPFLKSKERFKLLILAQKNTCVS